MWMNTSSVKKRSLTDAGVKKPRRRLAEDGQPVEEFGGGDGQELRQLVPDDPVAADAAGEGQPDQRYAGDPGVEAEAGRAPVGVFAHEMQAHDQHEGIGGVAVQAAQDAAEAIVRG